MDIDIDLADRSKLLALIKHHKATLSNGQPHNTGIYFTKIPHDPVTNQASIDYIDAQNRGYFKLDFLNLNLYKQIKNKKHLDELANREPLWELLEHAEFVKQLFHLSDHLSLLKKTKPKSLKQLAAVLSMIRPGKQHYADKPWEIIYKNIWKDSHNSDFSFKKSHAFAYAKVVIVHMNLICEQLLSNDV